MAARRPDRRRRRPSGSGAGFQVDTYWRMFRASDSAAGIGLGASGHVHLAEQHQALAFAVLQQRAVLEAEAAVEDRQEIAARGLLDQHRGHVAAIAAAPDARHRDVAPLDRGAVTRAASRNRAAAAGSSPRRASRAGAPRRARPAADDRAPAGRPAAGRTPATRNPNRFSRTSEVCSKTITFRPSRTRSMSRRRPVHGQRGLADDQHVVGRQIGVGVDGLARDAHAVEQRRRSRPWGRRARSCARAGSSAAPRGPAAERRGW